MLTWQSILSVMPPCPGMESPKSLILKPRLKPDAKKPPKGAMMEANIAITTACSCRCSTLSEPSSYNCETLRSNEAMQGAEVLSSSPQTSADAVHCWDECTAARVSGPDHSDVVVKRGGERGFKAPAWAAR